MGDLKKQPWWVLDRRSLELPLVRRGAFVVGVIGFACLIRSAGTQQTWLFATGVLLVVVGAVLSPPRRRRPEGR